MEEKQQCEKENVADLLVWRMKCFKFGFESPETVSVGQEGDGYSMLSKHNVRNPH